MTFADQNPAPSAPGVEGPRMPVLPIALLLFLIVAAVAGVMLLLRPHVAFTNALAAPVRLVVGDGSPQTVAPGSAVRVAVSRGRTVVVQWQLLLFLIVAAVAGVMLLLRPHVAFTNALAAPVRLVVGDGSPQTVAPGSAVRVAVSRGRTVVVQWQLLRPRSADGTPMGEEMRGSSVLQRPSGTTRLRSASRTADGAYFAPLITNASAQPLRLMVNAGLQGAVDCGCAVRAGGRRVFIGYYRLFRNSTVQARGTAARSAIFRDLGGQVTAADGSVGLRFEDRDLR